MATPSWVREVMDPFDDWDEEQDEDFTPECEEDVNRARELKRRLALEMEPA